MKIINKILGSAIAALAAIMVFACCWQVITRFLLKDPSQWTEEFLRYALIWMTMLGAPYAYGKDQHLAIRVLTDKFQPKNQVITKIAIEVIVLILSVSVFIVGGIMVTANSAGQISPALQLPLQSTKEVISSLDACSHICAKESSSFHSFLTDWIIHSPMMFFRKRKR